MSLLRWSHKKTVASILGVLSQIPCSEGKLLLRCKPLYGEAHMARNWCHWPTISQWKSKAWQQPHRWPWKGISPNQALSPAILLDTLFKCDIPKGYCPSHSTHYPWESKSWQCMNYDYSSGSELSLQWLKIHRCSGSNLNLTNEQQSLRMKPKDLYMRRGQKLCPLLDMATETQGTIGICWTLLWKHKMASLNIPQLQNWAVFNKLPS